MPRIPGFFRLGHIRRIELAETGFLAPAVPGTFTGQELFLAGIAIGLPFFIDGVIHDFLFFLPGVLRFPGLPIQVLFADGIQFLEPAFIRFIRAEGNFRFLGQVADFPVDAGQPAFDFRDFTGNPVGTRTLAD